MRILKGLAAGALAICGLAFTQAPASARTMTAPEMIQVATVQPGRLAETSATCHYRRHWRHPHYRRWHRWGYRPAYRWHRPFYGYNRPFYGYHRPFGWHHRWRHYY